MYLANRIGGTEPLKKAVDRSGSFEDPSLIRAAKEIQQLVDLNAFNKGFNGLSNDEGKSEFMNEKAAMYMMGTWELPNFTTNPDVPKAFKDNVGFFKFPTVSGGKSDVNSWVGGPGVGLFVAQNSKVKEESKKFVEYFVEQWGKVSVTDAGVIPATKVDTSAVQLPAMYIDLLKELNNASSITLFADVQMKPSAAEAHLNMIQAIFGKAVTPEDFAKKHEEALTKAASE
jgi:raffinose/stachyose/melibiose transport system substrate-binding protein